MKIPPITSSQANHFYESSSNIKPQKKSVDFDLNNSLAISIKRKENEQSSLFLDFSSSVQNLLNKLTTQKFETKDKGIIVPDYSHQINDEIPKELLIIRDHCLYTNHPLAKKNIPTMPAEPQELKIDGNIFSRNWKRFKKILKSGFSANYNEIKRKYKNDLRHWNLQIQELNMIQLEYDAENLNLTCLEFFEKENYNQLLSLAQQAQKYDPSNIRSKLIEFIACKHLDKSCSFSPPQVIAQFPLRNPPKALIYEERLLELLNDSNTYPEKLNSFANILERCGSINTTDAFNQKCILLICNAIYENISAISNHNKQNLFKYIYEWMDPLFEAPNDKKWLSSFFDEIKKPIGFNNLQLEWQYLSNILDIFIFMNLLKFKV